MVVALALQTGWQIKYASTLQKEEEEKGGKTSGVHRWVWSQMAKKRRRRRSLKGVSRVLEGGKSPNI